MGTPWRAQGVRISIEPCRVPLYQIGVPTETHRNPIWLDRTRRALTDHSTVPYQCTTHVRTYKEPHGTLPYHDGTQRDPTQPTKPDP